MIAREAASGPSLPTGAVKVRRARGKLRAAQLRWVQPAGPRRAAVTRYRPHTHSSHESRVFRAGATHGRGRLRMCPAVASAVRCDQQIIDPAGPNSEWRAPAAASSRQNVGNGDEGRPERRPRPNVPCVLRRTGVRGRTAQRCDDSDLQPRLPTCMSYCTSPSQIRTPGQARRAAMAQARGPAWIAPPRRSAAAARQHGRARPARLATRRHA